MILYENCTRLTILKKSNNIESNNFVRDYNEKLIELEKEGTKLTLNLKRKLRNDMYDNYYKKEIVKEASNKGFIRFEDNTKFRVNEKPDLVTQQNYKNISDEEITDMILKKG